MIQCYLEHLGSLWNPQVWTFVTFFAFISRCTFTLSLPAQVMFFAVHVCGFRGWSRAATDLMGARTMVRRRLQWSSRETRKPVHSTARDVMRHRTIPRAHSPLKTCRYDEWLNSQSWERSTTHQHSAPLKLMTTYCSRVWFIIRLKEARHDTQTMASSRIYSDGQSDENTSIFSS